MFYSTRHAPHSAFCFVIRKSFFRLVDVAISLQCLRCYLSLATTNALARGSLKDAANCAKHLELQISEKEKDSERILRVDLVSAHVIGGDRNMQSLKLWSLGGFTCCRKFLRRRVRVIQRVSRFRAALWFVSWCSIAVMCFVLKTQNIFTHAHDQSRDYPLNLSI